MFRDNTAKKQNKVIDFNEQPDEKKLDRIPVEAQHGLLSQMSVELEALENGNLDDTFLLDSIAGNVSVGQFTKVAQFRGRSWGFLGALSDSTLEIQGITMKHLIADIAEHNYRESSVLKALVSAKRLRQFKRLIDADDDLGQAIIDDALSEIMIQAHKSRESLARAMDALVSRY